MKGAELKNGPPQARPTPPHHPRGREAGGRRGPPRPQARPGPRKLVDFDGPYGWKQAAINTGLLTFRPEGELGVPWAVRARHLPHRDRGALRGAHDGAGRRLARRGARPAHRGAPPRRRRRWPRTAPSSTGSRPGTSRGSTASSAHPPHDHPGRLRPATPRWWPTASSCCGAPGVNGPDALALAPACYAGLAQSARGRPPHPRAGGALPDGPTVPAPAIDGAVLLSHRGGDFQLSVGQDLSIGSQGYVNGVAHLVPTLSPSPSGCWSAPAAVYLKPLQRGKR